MANDLRNKLLEAMKKRGVNVPNFSKQTGIPKDRIYKWYQQGTNIKPEDALIVDKWINEVAIIPERDERSKIMAELEPLLTRIIQNLALNKAQIDWMLPIVKKMEIDRISKLNQSLSDISWKVEAEIDELIEERYQKVLTTIRELFSLK